MQNTKLSEKLIFSFVILSIISLSITGIVLFYVAKNALLANTYNQLISVQVIKKRQLETFFNDRFADLNHLYRIVKVKSNSIDAEITNEKYISEDLHNYLESFIIQNNYYSKIIIFDNQKNILHSITDTTIYQSESDSLLKLSIEEKINNRNINFLLEISNKDTLNLSSHSIYFGRRILDKKGEISAYFLLEVSLETINRIMLETGPESGLGKSGESYLVGEDYLMRSSSRFESNSIKSTQVNTIGVNKGLRDISGIGKFLDYRGIMVLSAYSKLDIPNLNWVILAEKDLKEATLKIRELRDRFLFFTLIISLIVFTITYLIANKIANPLLKLKKAAEKIGKGEYDERLEVNSNDEIGMLTQTLNEMADQILRKENELISEKSNRMKQVIDAQEKERERLSRELHDGIGQIFIALKLKLEASLNEVDNEKMLNEVLEDLDRTIIEIRRISNDLMPSVLKEFGLKVAIKKLIKEYNRISDIEFQIDWSIENDQLSKNSSIHIFRILQEALSNALRHSKAKNVDIIIRESDERVIFEIKDNGIGFSKPENEFGNGIHNMKERVSILQGIFELSSKENMGTKINIIFYKHRIRQ